MKKPYDEELMHYGTPMKSGRYPWGSGENPYHHGASSPWGKRRADRKAKRSEEKAIRRDRRSASRGRRKLSDEELVRRIGRLEREKRLKELTYDDLYPGKRAVDQALGEAGKKLITGIAIGTGATLVTVLASKYGGNGVNKSELTKILMDSVRPKRK